MVMSIIQTNSRSTADLFALAYNNNKHDISRESPSIGS